MSSDKGKPWSSADLGDDERNKKFMRLMGGSKDKHKERKGNVNETSSDTKKNSGSSEKVHSANKWEEANLGDEDRRNKFLKLMGAKKKEHHGPFVIGDSNREHQKQDDIKDIQHNLESQYNQSMEMKLSGSARRHTGLGFHGDTSTNPSSSPQPDSNKETSTEKCSKDKTEPIHSGETKSSERTNSQVGQEKGKRSHVRFDSDGEEEKPAEPTSLKAKYMKMSFVKSDS